jgi:hypothetical protein
MCFFQSSYMSYVIFVCINSQQESPFLILFICGYRRLLGKDLTGLGLKELQHLEQQINEGLLSVKERKVLILTLSYFFVFLPPPHQCYQISAMDRHVWLQWHFFTTAISNLWRMAAPWHFMVNTAAQNVGFLAFRIRNQ